LPESRPADGGGDTRARLVAGGLGRQSHRPGDALFRGKSW